MLNINHLLTLLLSKCESSFDIASCFRSHIPQHPAAFRQPPIDVNRVTIVDATVADGDTDAAVPTRRPSPSGEEGVGGEGVGGGGDAAPPPSTAPTTTIVVFIFVFFLIVVVVVVVIIFGGRTC